MIPKNAAGRTALASACRLETTPAAATSAIAAPRYVAARTRGILSPSSPRTIRRRCTDRSLAKIWNWCAFSDPSRATSPKSTKRKTR